MTLCYLWQAIPVELHIIVFLKLFDDILLFIYELGSSDNKLLYVLFCLSLPGDWLSSSAHTHVSVQSNWSMEPPTNLHMVDSPIQQQYVRTSFYSFCLILKNLIHLPDSFFLLIFNLNTLFWMQRATHIIAPPIDPKDTNGSCCYFAG